MEASFKSKQKVLWDVRQDKGSTEIKWVTLAITKNSWESCLN